MEIIMNDLRTKQFQILTDIDLAWELMTDVYDHEETNVPTTRKLTCTACCHKGFCVEAWEVKINERI